MKHVSQRTAAVGKLVSIRHETVLKLAARIFMAEAKSQYQLLSAEAADLVNFGVAYLTAAPGLESQGVSLVEAASLFALESLLLSTKIKDNIRRDLLMEHFGSLRHIGKKTGFEFQLLFSRALIAAVARDYLNERSEHTILPQRPVFCNRRAWSLDLFLGWTS